LAALVLAAISFVATSLWALFGTAIKTYLRNPRLILIVNILLSLSLVYTAIALVGIL
jgi:cysteine/O-acetylserine efflux protein